MHTSLLEAALEHVLGTMPESSPGEGPELVEFTADEQEIFELIGAGF